MSTFVKLENRYTGDVQEFVPSAVDSLIQSGVWKRFVPKPQQIVATPAGVVETATVQPGLAERVIRTLFQRGPSSRA